MGADPEEPDEPAGPVVGAGARCTEADGEPVPAHRAGSGAGARAGLAGPRAPVGGREPLHGGRGPVGGTAAGGDTAADRLARARRVLHRVEGRADSERARPEPGMDGALLPVPGPLTELLPGGGLRRGSTVAVTTGAGAGSLLFALLAAASAEGAWAGVVGRPGLGTTAAAEAGVRLDRLALVPDPGTDLVPVTAALLDGLDLVVVAGPDRAGLRAADRQRLAARARQRGAVLLALGSWPGADVRLQCVRAHWEGTASGAGRLRARRVEVRAHGRGTGPAGRAVEVLLPGPAGAVGALPTTALPDAGLPDAGLPDAGLPDAGLPDAGFPAAVFSGGAVSSAGAGRSGSAVPGDPAGRRAVRAAG
ncbi:hypothetical protein ACLFMI_08465 [Pseudonocardia nantongensis]|uniref:hypothetical protein n=1 Tax=Pseudonocardia nantongensis TaxID=1181885 RepID=UPI00397B6EDA